MSLLKHISLKRSNARGFFFFLLLTTVFAILSKLSKTYSTVYSLAIEVKGVPLDKVVSTIEPAYLEVTTSLSGFALLANQFSDYKLDIDFKDLEKATSTSHVYFPENHPLEIADAIKGVTEVSAIRPQQVTVLIDSLSSKKVQVTTQINIKYINGFGPNGASVITPDFVSIIGPKAAIDTIKTIYTTPKTLDDVSQNIDILLVADSLALHEEVKLSTHEFLFKQEVTKFTEGSFSIPVTIKNNESFDVKVFPKTIDVYFTASLDVFDEITSSDFQVICDFSKRNDQEDLIPLELIKLSSTIKKSRLATKQVKFIVVN